MKLRRTPTMAIASLVLATAMTVNYAQESTQPQAEIEVVEQFQSAADSLFVQWLSDRPRELKRVALGYQGTAGPQCKAGAWGNAFFEFIECSDIETPTDYSLDVIRTDSLLSPFVGIIEVSVFERCTVRRAWAGRWTKRANRAKFNSLQAHCYGKTFQECIAAGAEVVTTSFGVLCTGGPGFQFSYKGKARMTYRWSKGKWEFDREETDPPRDARREDTRAHQAGQPVDRNNERLRGA